MSAPARGAATIVVRVRPGSSRAGVRHTTTGLLVHTNARAADGKANREAIARIAAFLDVPGSRLTILRGEKSRDKVIAVEGISAGEIAERARER
jgi:hypothetical protein